MVTKYDVYEIIYSQGPLKAIEIALKFGKSEKNYKNIYRILSELEKEGLIFRELEKFSVKKQGKHKALYEIINYCLSNNVNYNLLIDKNLINFVLKGLEKGEINQKISNLNPRTFSKYIDILNRYGLILLISKKPIKAGVFYNTLINNLLVYFDFKYIEIQKREPDYINEIKKELTLYTKLRRKNEVGFKKIVEEFQVSFVHHSLSLEGNPITLPDTIKILKDKIIPSDLKSEDVDEVKNYQTAILQMLKDSQQKIPLSIESILNYHKLAMAHKPEIAGKIREVGVFIKGNPNFKVSEAGNIRGELKELYGKYNIFVNENKKEIKDILKFATYFHNEFQYIHPFIDGNSRITRLITFHLLNSKDIPILDIPFGLLDDYLNQTKGSKERDDINLLKSFERIILFNLKKINERLRK